MTRLIASTTLEPHDVYRTDLDSHANMFVAGSGVTIIAESGNTASVHGYSDDIPARNIPIVDCALMYQCPYTNNKYILIAKDALHVPTMNHNLVPPFMLREAGILVDTTPKIHHDNPDESIHSLFFKDENLRIPLSLHGVFSYFPTSKPTDNDLQDDRHPVLMLTPLGPWNPHSTHYSRNEDNMLDWNGDIQETTVRQRLFIDVDEVPDDEYMISLLTLSSDEYDLVSVNAMSVTDGWTDHPTTQPTHDIQGSSKHCIPLLD